MGNKKGPPQQIQTQQQSTEQQTSQQTQQQQPGQQQQQNQQQQQQQQNRQYNCDICGMSFNLSGELKSHKNALHKDHQGLFNEE